MVGPPLGPLACVSFACSCVSGGSAPWSAAPTCRASTSTTGTTYHPPPSLIGSRPCVSPDCWRRSSVLCCCFWCCSAVSVLGGLGSPVSVLLSPTGASQGNMLNNLQANNNTNSGPRVTKFTLVTTGYDVREEDYHRCLPARPPPLSGRSTRNLLLSLLLTMAPTCAAVVAGAVLQEAGAPREHGPGAALLPDGVPTRHAGAALTRQVGQSGRQACMQGPVFSLRGQQVGPRSASRSPPCACLPGCIWVG